MKLAHIAACFAAVTLSATAAWADYPKMKLRMAHFGPKVFVQSSVDQWFADQIEQRSGGNIKIQILWAGSGGQPLEILGLVGSGATDLGAVPPAYYANELPLIGTPNALPHVFNTREAALAVSDGLVRDNKAVQDELRRNNIKPLFFHTLNPFFPLCTKPIKTLDDFKGLKIRSFGAFQPPMWEALGAIGENILPADMYEGLQRGRLDCGFFSSDLYKVTKLYEVAKYRSTAGVGPVTTWPIWVNLDAWENKYTEETRQLFLQVAQEAQQRSLDALAIAETEALEFISSQGVETVEIENLQAYHDAIPDMIEVWLDNMRAKGLGEQAQSVADYWRAKQSEIETGSK